MLLIKRYMPKYNILLKDDKGYPYLRLDMTEEYPKITLVNKLAHDGAAYFGPYGSRGMTQNVLDSIRLALKLPGCNRQFPRDLGKDRPCLNYHLNQCRGWCQLSRSPAEYRDTMEQAKLLLSGNYQKLAQELRDQMLEASENLEFERAAELRDRLKAIEALGQKQLVTAGSLADTDVIGFDQTAAKSCFVVLHYSGGISWIKSTKSTRSRTIRRRRCPAWSSSTIWRGASPRKSFYSRWRWRTAAFSQI